MSKLIISQRKRTKKNKKCSPMIYAMTTVVVRKVVLENHYSCKTKTNKNIFLPAATMILAQGKSVQFALLLALSLTILFNVKARVSPTLTFKQGY